MTTTPMVSLTGGQRYIRICRYPSRVILARANGVTGVGTDQRAVIQYAGTVAKQTRQLARYITNGDHIHRPV